MKLVVMVEGHAFGTARGVFCAARLSAYVPEERFVGENQFASVFTALANIAPASPSQLRCCRLGRAAGDAADVLNAPVVGDNDVCCIGLCWGSLRAPNKE